MSKSIRELEYEWFAIRSEEPGNSTLSQHKFGYFASKSIPAGTLSEMEQRWLQEAGSSTSINPYELWVAACQAQTVAVGRSIDECKYNFYSSVASGTNP